MSEDRFRDFDAALAEEEGEPITFRLAGRKWKAVHLSAPVMLKLGRAISDNRAVFGYDEAMRDFLPEEDREAFTQALIDHNVRIRTLMDVVNWIIEADAGRPLGDASPSLEQPSPTGGGSKVVSLSGASTSGGSHSAAG